MVLDFHWSQNPGIEVRPRCFVHQCYVLAMRDEHVFLLLDVNAIGEPHVHWLTFNLMLYEFRYCCALHTMFTTRHVQACTQPQPQPQLPRISACTPTRKPTQMRGHVQTSSVHQNFFDCRSCAAALHLFQLLTIE